METHNKIPERINSSDCFKTAVVASDGSCTYDELNKKTDLMSRFLRARGVKDGAHVAIWGYNSVNWLISFFAVIKAGGIAELINYSLGCDDVRTLMEIGECDFLIFGDNGMTKRENPDSASLASRLSIDPDRCIDIRANSDVFAKIIESTEWPSFTSERSSDDTAIMIFTSGTTSLPKGVLLSEGALCFSADAFNEKTKERAGDKVCVAVPLFHILGLLMTFSCLCRGGTVFLPPDYKPNTLQAEIRENQITDMVAVGAVYTGLSESDGFENCGVQSVGLCMIAGGMATPVSMMRLELKFSNAVFINMYGLSEAAPLTMVGPEDLVEKRATTVGKPVDGITVKISDGNGGFLQTGGIGEVVAKGPNLMKGYFGLPAEKQAIDENGWLHTGDLGWFDEEDYLHLAGRIKDIIIRGGENISPSEVENALAKAEGIKEAKVLGAPHPIYGESVEACVTLSGGSEAFDESKIKTFLKTLIPGYKLPSHIFIYESFPLNVNGKLDQRKLKADMLMKLRMLMLDNELAGGITVFDIVVKNKTYSIVPVTGLVGELAEHLGFSGSRVLMMRLAVEEMLTERITDAYSTVGDLRVKIVLMPEWLRVSFSDSGTEYNIDKRYDTSLSAKIILKAVDDFHTDYHDKTPVYCMDFLYEDEVDIKGFMVKSEEVTQ